MNHNAACEDLDYYFGYKDLQDYLNHLYDVTYLTDSDQTVLMHMQESGDDRGDAIKRARAVLGDVAYIVSVTKHAQDLNPLE